MRAFLAAALSLYVALAALAPHVHVATGGQDECAVCLASGRGAAPASVEAPVVAPPEYAGEEPLPPAVMAPVVGAPLGAVPGQSPPVA
ncbi:MAG TPA: hypothetical protein VLT47_00520 [Anaeromyxobacteraceae bacterium]|nr:hypothetical protein [Anaeromyxobacteraceae bacterium]